MGNVLGDHTRAQSKNKKKDNVLGDIITWGIPYTSFAMTPITSLSPFSLDYVTQLKEFDEESWERKIGSTGVELHHDDDLGDGGVGFEEWKRGVANKIRTAFTTPFKNNHIKNKYDPKIFQITGIEGDHRRLRFIINTLEKYRTLKHAVLLSREDTKVKFWKLDRAEDIIEKFDNTRVKSEVYGSHTDDLFTTHTMTIKIFKIKDAPVGGYFPFLTKYPELDLSRYGIHHRIDPKNYHINCLQETFLNSGLMTDAEMEDLYTYCKTQYIPQRALKDISDRYKINITLTKRRGGQKAKILYKAKNADRSISIGLLHKHYFLIEKTKYRSYALKHLDEKYDDWKTDDKWFNHYQLYTKAAGNNKTIDSFKAIELCLKHNLLNPISLSTDNILLTQYYGDPSTKQDFKTLGYDTHKCLKECAYKEKLPEKIENIYVIDFESTTDGDKHIPYMCCILGIPFNTGNKNYFDIQACFSMEQQRQMYENRPPEEEKKTMKEFLGALSKDKVKEYCDRLEKEQSVKETFYGPQCGKYALEAIPNNSLVLCHNLGYDFCFLKEYLRIDSIIEKGKQTKSVDCKYFERKLLFRDTLAFIPLKLSEFASTFHLSVDKEIMPYKLYNNETVHQQHVGIRQAIRYVKPWDKEEFEKRARKSFSTTVNGKVYFKHIDYAKYYCELDCKVLMNGFMVFRSMIHQLSGIDILGYVSLASISYAIQLKEGCLDGCLSISGVPRKFIEQSIVGGRCMTAGNMMWHTKEPVDVLDYVSLYPSAMAQFPYPKGRPRVIPDWVLSQSHEEIMSFLNEGDAYIVEITNIVAHKHRMFPLLSKLENGKRVFTNVFEPNEKVVIGKIGLEDFIQFQSGTFKIVRGYHFRDDVNPTGMAVISNLFKNRKIYKDCGNPLEKVIKLLLNCSYGRMLLHEHASKKTFIGSDKEYENFIWKKSAFIRDIAKMGNEHYVITETNPVSSHFNNCHIASGILEMSKRIVNRAICLAEDLGCFPFYQDTDSIHILQKDVSRLFAAYKEKYGVDLYGKNLGQMHPDLKATYYVNGKRFDIEEGLLSVESFYVAKKVYLERPQKFIDGIPEGPVYDSAKFKGAPIECLEELAKTKYAGSMAAVFGEMYDGYAIKIDIALTKETCFKRSNIYDMSTLKSFPRRFKFPKDGEFICGDKLYHYNAEGDMIVSKMTSEKA